jgi:hypothetical protein
MKGLQGKRVEAASRGAAMWASRGGAVGLRGEGLDTSIAFAPTPALAARLLERLTLG